DENRYRDRFVGELRSWLDANPPLIGINWASMLELAFRSMSWLWAIGFFADASARDDNPWLVDLLVALDRQLAHVEHNLSYYFSPNTHLTGEALALYVAGRALPELAASDRRARVGRRVMLDEARRQIAADGGHRERSTHYHRYTLDFYVLASIVARLTQLPGANRVRDVARRMAGCARAAQRGSRLHPASRRRRRGHAAAAERARARRRARQPGHRCSARPAARSADRPAARRSALD